MSNSEIAFWVVFGPVLGVAFLVAWYFVSSALWTIMTGPYLLVKALIERRKIDRMLREASRDE